MEGEAAERDAAGGVCQQAAEGVTRAGANRPLNAGLHGGLQRADIETILAGIGDGERRCLDQIRVVDRAFETDDPIVELPIISSMAAEDDAVRVAGQRIGTGETAGRPIAVCAVIGAPSVTDLTTGVESRPAESRPVDRGRDRLRGRGDLFRGSSGRGRRRGARQAKRPHRLGSKLRLSAVRRRESLETRGVERRFAELVVEADLDLVLGQVAFAGVIDPGGGKGCGGLRDFAVIRIAIFGAHRPIVVDRVIRAAAKGPAQARRRTVVRGGEVRLPGVGV